MNPFSIDIKDLLVAAGIGVFGATTGWNISIGTEPAAPRDAITIYDSGGFKPITFTNKSNDDTIGRPSCQVRVRSKAYQDGWDKAQEIVDEIGHKGGFDTATYHYADIDQQTAITGIGRDENKNHLFTINFLGIRSKL